MSVYKSIMQGLTETVDYQQRKIHALKTKLTIKPVAVFNNDDIKRIRLKAGLNQVFFLVHLEFPLKQWKKGKMAVTNQKALPAVCLKSFWTPLSF